VEAVRGQTAVSQACEVIGVSQSGYYAWRGRSESKRRPEDPCLTVYIRAAYKANRGTYGAPRVHAELLARGFSVRRGRVTRLMQEEGIKAFRRRRRRSHPPQADGRRRGADPPEKFREHLRELEQKRGSG
jgi:putative transposase